MLSEYVVNIFHLEWYLTTYHFFLYSAMLVIVTGHLPWRAPSKTESEMTATSSKEKESHGRDGY
jgi:septal ring-binding cell division protein DamX